MQTNNTRTCVHCGNEIPEDVTMYETEDGLVCSDCIDNYVECGDCGALIYVDNARWIETESNYFCDSCVDDNFGFCDHCQEYHRRDNLTWLDRYDIDVCESCLYDGFVRCADCGDWISVDEAFESGDSWYCGDCYATSDIHSYSYKPDPNFHKAEGEVHGLGFGIEDEVSLDGRDDRIEALEILRDVLNDGDYSEPNCYGKEDSSISDFGVEFVFHPRTLKSWLEYKPVIAEAFEKLRNLADGDDDGLHIHTSRRGMSMLHRMRYEAFMDACQDEIVTIARRSASRWAEHGKKPETGADLKEKGQRNEKRYRAVNWQNDNTVELRIFRSTLDVTEFYASLEFAHALYRFTKLNVSLVQLVRDPKETWKNFLRYVRRDKRYSDLINFLRDSYKEAKIETAGFWDCIKLSHTK